MNMHPVNSHTLVSVGYEDGELRITFKGGRTYSYKGGGVEQHYEALISVESPGTYFHANLKNAPGIEVRRV